MDLVVSILNTIIGFFSKFSKIIGYLYNYRNIYKITGIFATRKFKKTSNYHKYAILIPARNEQTVIGNLIDSIRANDYPQELITIFVVADNCSDKTAQVARDKGCICYERFDMDRRTKGFALQFLMNKIKEDYGSLDVFEGYFLFDADNLLKQDYITRMNESFDEGEKVITSYRSSKNFDDNWISASYAIHWLRTVRSEHRARSLFRLATRIQGTGCLIATEVIPNGWDFTSLTEDRELSASAVVRGYKISYNHAAIFYDEQPTDIRVALVQRLRWAKGHLQALRMLGGKLFLNIFKFNKMSFISFDMLSVVWPRSLETVVRKIIVFLLRLTILILTGAAAARYGSLIYWLIYWEIYSYVSGIITAVYVFAIEHKRIPKMSFIKKLWFCITFPIFDVIGKISMLVAIFVKVEWKPTLHTSSIRIEELSQR